MDRDKKVHVKKFLEKAMIQSESVKEIREGVNGVESQRDIQRKKSIGLLKLKIIKEIHETLNEYLIKKFGKEINEYKKHMVRLKKENIFECISVVEGVVLENLWNVFYRIVCQKREKYKKSVPDFLYFLEEDGVDEEFIEKLRKKDYVVLKANYIPFDLLRFREDVISDSDLLNYSRLILVFVRRVIEERVGHERDVGEGERIFKQILEAAVSRRVSDIHIIPGVSYYYVYFREDGFFNLQRDFILSFEQAENLIVYMMRRAAEEVGGQFNPDTRLAYQDARISFVDKEFFLKQKFDLRIAFIPDGTPRAKLEVCMRVLYKDGVSASVEQDKVDLVSRLKGLGYFEEDVRILKNILLKKNGIVIISGITNSGKSTLVSNLLSSIRDKKIGTIEDPIEYYIDIPNYVQHQLFISDQEKISMDFVDYVKAFKRSDYDIVFVGEWRNHRGLTEAILEQAYAGQLIFTTLHIGSSFQVLKGLESVFEVNIEELKPVLLLVWSQILVPRLCSSCKKKVKHLGVKAEVLEVVKTFPGVTKDLLKQLETFTVYEGYVRGDGCDKCGGRGYKERQVVYDYFLPNVEFWERLGTDYSHYNVLKSAEIKKTKIDIFLKLVKMGLVDINDIYLVF